MGAEILHAGSVLSIRGSWSASLLIVAGLGCGAETPAAASNSEGLDTVMVVGRIETTQQHEIYSGLISAKLLPGVGLAYATEDLRLVVVGWDGSLVMEHEGSREGPGYMKSIMGMDSFGDTLAAFEYSGQIHLFVQGKFLRTDRVFPTPPEGFSFTLINLLGTNEMVFGTRETRLDARQGLVSFAPDRARVVSQRFGRVRVDENLRTVSGDQPVAAHHARGGTLVEWESNGDTLWVHGENEPSVLVASTIIDARVSSGGSVWVQDRSGVDGGLQAREFSQDGRVVRVLPERYPWDSIGDTILELRPASREYSTFPIMIVTTGDGDTAIVPHG